MKKWSEEPTPWSGTIIQRAIKPNIDIREDLGTYFAPQGTNIHTLSLKPDVYNVITYKVNTGIVTNKSLSIPWFGEPGLGTQYRMNRTAKYLIEKKIITPIKKDPLFGK